MRNLRPTVTGVILCVLSPLGPMAAAADDNAQLKLRVEQLELEVKALRGEVTRLREELAGEPAVNTEQARLALDIRLLSHLVSAVDKEPDNLSLRKDTADLARRLAREWPGRVAWNCLLKLGVLHDGISIGEAERILGPQTDEFAGHVGWYFNPHGRHVAPYLHAKVTEEVLTEWGISNR